MPYTLLSRSRVKTILTFILSLAVLSVQTAWSHNLQRQSALDPASLSSPRGVENAQSQNRASQGINHATRTRISEAYGKLPLSFETNQGQVKGETKFVSRGDGYELFLKPTEAVLSLRRSSKQSEGKSSPVKNGNPERRAVGEEQGLLRMQIVNADPAAKIAGVNELPGKANYFVGDDRAAWRTNVPTYAQVRYSNVYPAIDLVYYGTQRQLEYDFEFAPGVSSDAFKFSFQGATCFVVNSQGELVLTTSAGDVILRKPVAYQKINGERREIASRFVLRNKNQVGFKIGDYDRSQLLVIDPTLAYSTYLGGNGPDEGDAISVDAAGNAYIAGETGSTDFPANGIKSAALRNVFVAKLNPTGSAILYSVYIGGSRTETAHGITTDAAGNAYIVGGTASIDFPTVNPIQATSSLPYLHGFIAKLDPTGSGLVYSTYLGGTRSDEANSVAVDGNGSAYITGYTRSLNFPVANAIQATRSGSPSFKSTDAGDHWASAAKGLSVAFVNSLAIDPSNPVTLYAGTDFGIFKSSNGGGNWNAIGASQINGTVNKLAIDHLNPSTLYAITTGALYKSTDGGNNWSLLSPPQIPISIAVDPSNGNTLYVGYRNAIFKSIDGGAHFSSNILVGNFSTGNVNSVAINPTNTSIVWAGTDHGVY